MNTKDVTVEQRLDLIEAHVFALLGSLIGRDAAARFLTLTADAKEGAYDRDAFRDELAADL